MGNRMDKYKKDDGLPTRSNKNKELYKQIYNAYDDFENLIVPSNAREITLSDLKKEITSRSEYRENKEVLNIEKKETGAPEIVYIEKKEVKTDSNDEVYDINELLDKAVSEPKEEPEKVSISNGDYLKKLKLDNRKTNIEQIKESYEEIQDDDSMEDESLLKTANLSLEILSDLKSDNESTKVSAPIKNEELPDNHQDTFYSTNYKFTKKDFEDKDDEEDDEEDDESEDEEKSGDGKFFLKILLLIFGILLIAGVLFFIIRYFNKV